MAVIEALRAFFEECPLLRDGKINLNYLAPAPSYSLESEAAEPVVRKYADGGELRQYVFVFASREFYDENDVRNMDAATFYESLEDWIRERNASGRLPALGEGLEPQKIEVTRTHCVASSKNAAARYELKGRLIYRKKG